MIKTNSKVRIKGKPIKGVSFKVLSVDKYNNATIEHSLSKSAYNISIHELELIK